MDQRRLLLQQLLLRIAPNVYFQPPENHKMKYPCIVYERDQQDAKFADGIPYSRTDRYQVTVIDPDPDSDIRIKVASLPLSAFQRHYAKDQLNHDIYSLYY